jgi:hypothetical protein
MTGQPPTPDEVRAEAIAVAAKEIASWESDPSPNSRHFACGEGVVDALTQAGLLPTEVDSRYIGRGMQRRWRLATGWKEPGE